MDNTARVEVAYDLSRFDSRRRVREALENEPVAIPSTPAQMAAAATRKRARAKTHSISFFHVFSFAALFTVFLFVVMSYMQLNELSVNISRSKTELARLENTGAKLKIEYERNMNLRDIDVRAAELGLYLPDSSQVVYVDISKPDRAVVYEQESGGFIEGLQSLFAAVTDFFE